MSQPALNKRTSTNGRSGADEVGRRGDLMRIHDDHMFHGAALIQIAEHPSFTAINSLRTAAGVFHNAYRVNQDVAVYLKYASKPTPAFDEYQFTFTQAHLEELDAITSVSLKLFIALVCVEDRQICCLKYSQLLELVDYRRKSKGADESQYVVLATLPENKAFRVYMNAAGAKKRYAGKQLIVARNSFPSGIFD
jgi:hypothetical protein